MKRFSLVVAAAIASQQCALAHGPTEPRPATDDWCINGTPLDIGECLCEWQSEQACQGPGCMRQMGLSWYRPSCKDCSCLPDKNAKPKKKQPKEQSKKAAPAPESPKVTGEADTDSCDTDCEWKNAGGADDAAAKPASATDTLDAAGNDRDGSYPADDNDDFEDGLSSDEYLNMLNELEAEAKNRNSSGNFVLVAAAAVAVAIVMMIVFRTAVPTPKVTTNKDEATAAPNDADDKEETDTMKQQKSSGGGEAEGDRPTKSTKVD